ncbi:hypothetical protein JIN82_03120 [Persicirhabdus sediminis]|uniref:Uncharacterized protein n=2 Tax=Persicirhabdus sediminis TaxID=454144 RepID=A0A8J7SL34_9BACT|nr:hypothetical protein [Persicirhabdus sediminis]
MEFLKVALMLIGPLIAVFIFFGTQVITSKRNLIESLITRRLDLHAEFSQLFLEHNLQAVGILRSIETAKFSNHAYSKPHEHVTPYLNELTLEAELNRFDAKKKLALVYTKIELSHPDRLYQIYGKAFSYITDTDKKINEIVKDAKKKQDPDRPLKVKNLADEIKDNDAATNIQKAIKADIKKSSILSQSLPKLLFCKAEVDMDAADYI